MSEVKPLPESDLDDFLTIVANAYPAMEINSAEERDRSKGFLKNTYQEPERCIYGLYRHGQLLGGMILIDFIMNFRGTMISAGGVGLVAVDLLHKKEKVARDMMVFFLNHFRHKKTPILMLYPFSPDFYKKMGFGYGTKVNQYRIFPSALPRGQSNARVRFLESADKAAIESCHNRYFARAHGMVKRSDREWVSFFSSPSYRIVGIERNDRLEGYVTFSFRKGDTFLQNSLEVGELVYNEREALSELLGFLHKQFDQIDWLVINTLDEDFHNILSDPRNSSRNLVPHVYHESNTQGVGLMYRVIDVTSLVMFLKSRQFADVTFNLKVTLKDSFFPENAGSINFQFEGGRPRKIESDDHDVEINLDISEFSSLLMGAVRFKKLFDYGLAEVSDLGFIPVVDELFRSEEKPVCLARF